MQAAFQKHVHASISKTINMPNTATKKDCADALLMAWQLKLKGITIYREGSRNNAVLNLKGTHRRCGCVKPEKFLHPKKPFSE